MASVQIQNAYKYYGSSSNPKIVLNYLNMNVEKGSIYGLLGASGCGKTTLLSCIVGQRDLISGDIRVLGLKPGSPGSGLPGPLIGYMPQEIALVEELTVKETIYYFGRIYDMDEEKIDERYNLLKNLLELPPGNRFVGQCSGGQKRRVSFACALVHEPEILILDEPTVGLDPILREKIWDFLVETTRNSKMACIITTHYIEEANKANRIGLMRNGILLAEDTPENIICNMESTSLEDAFLKLSQRQGSEDVIKKITHGESSGLSNTNVGQLDQILSESHMNYRKRENVNKQQKSFLSANHMKALLTKNLIQITRQPATIIFMLVLPILGLTCHFWSIGVTPQNLRIGIVNDEVPNYEKCFDKSLITILNHNNNDTCEFNKISCRYIDEINQDIGEKVFYSSLEEAHKSAKKAKIVGYIHFPHNFSKSMQTFIEDGRFAEDSIFDSMQLTVRLDHSDLQSVYVMQRSLRNIYKTFVEGLMIGCHLPRALGSIPISFENILYGSLDDDFQRFITPGIIIVMIFFMASIMTSGIFITERTDGIWDRTLIAGISKFEMLSSHLTIQSTIVIFQCLEAIFYSSLVYGYKNEGDNLTIIILLILEGFCGMFLGLLISIYCSRHMLALFINVGIFFPMLALSGLLWPREGMYYLLKYPVSLFPFTISVDSARNILFKGWPITNYQVYNGFITIICWIIIFVVLCIFGLRRKM